MTLAQLLAVVAAMPLIVTGPAAFDDFGPPDDVFLCKEQTLKVAFAEDQEPARGEQICAPDISFDVFVEEILLVGLEGPAAAKSTGGVVPQATTSTTTNTAKDARQTKTDHGMRRSRA